jgi:hypothetical protein
VSRNSQSSESSELQAPAATPSAPLPPPTSIIALRLPLDSPGLPPVQVSRLRSKNNLPTAWMLSPPLPPTKRQCSTT